MPSLSIRCLLSILFILLIYPAATVQAQESEPQTQVYIIGLKHDGNAKFNHQTLLKKLKEWEPDLILWEQNIEFKRIPGMLTGKFPGLARPGIEQTALQKYTRYNRKCRVLPYDMNVGDRHKFIRESSIKKNRLYYALEKKAESRTMTVADSTAFWDFKNNYFKYFADIDEMELEALNGEVFAERTRNLFNNNKNLIVGLAEKYVSDTSLKSWFQQSVSLWDTRNQYMGNQIATIISDKKPKKLVVLTGAAHKYYLLDILREMKHLPFRIEEWERIKR